jgi:hypothetical protein
MGRAAASCHAWRATATGRPPARHACLGRLSAGFDGQFPDGRTAGPVRAVRPSAVRLRRQARACMHHSIQLQLRAAAWGFGLPSVRVRPPPSPSLGARDLLFLLRAQGQGHIERTECASASRTVMRLGRKGEKHAARAIELRRSLSVHDRLNLPQFLVGDLAGPHRWYGGARVNLPSHQIRNLMFGSIRLSFLLH